MAKRKTREESKKIQSQIDNPPPPTIAWDPSKSVIQQMIQAFDNPNDKAGIETMTMGHEWPWKKTVESIADDILLYASKPTSFSLMDYFNENGIDWWMHDVWIEKSMYYQRKYTRAQEFIGARRELWASRYDSGYIPSTLAKSLPTYSRDYRRLREWEKSLDNKQDQQPTTINVTVSRGNNVNGRSDDREDMQFTVEHKASAGEAGDGTEESQEP